jgi:HEAT repeat protein
VLPVLAEPDAGVRAAGAEALGVVGAYAVKSGSEPGATREAVTTLTGLLKDRDPGVRGAAARALGTIAGVVARPSSGRGRGPASESAPAASPSPVAFDPAAVTTSLLELLKDRDAGVRQEALCGLRDCAPRSAGEPPQPLFEAVEDESATNRAIAVGVLAGYANGLDPFVPVLLRHLEHDEPSMRDACRHALGRIRPSALSSASIPVLIAGLGSRDRDVRRHLVSLLAGRDPDPRTAVPALIKVVREPDDSDWATMEGRAMSMSYEGPAQEAAKAIGRLAPGTPAAAEAMTALADIVRSGPAQRRAAAAEALGRFGPAAAQAVPDLIAYLQAAASSKEGTDDGASAAEALEQIAPGTPAAVAAVPALTDALRSDSVSTRGGALRALRSFGAAAAPAVESLRTLEKNDPTPKIRKDAAATLEAIQGKLK